MLGLTSSRADQKLFESLRYLSSIDGVEEERS